MTTLANITPASMNVVGPYSPWPRRPNRRRFYGWAGAISGAAVFVHCVVPMIA